MTDTRAQLGADLRKRLFAGMTGGSAMPERINRYTTEHLFGDVWQGEERSGAAG